MVKIGDRMVVAVKLTAIMYDRYCHRISMRSDDEEVGSMGQRRWYSSNNNNNNNNDDNLILEHYQYCMMMIKVMEVIRQGMVIKVTASASHSL